MRHTARSLIRAPAFTAGAVLIIALGIASTTGLFTVVNGVLLRPLPYRHSERLVATGLPLLNADFRDVKTESRSFDDAALLEPRTYLLAADGRGTSVGGAEVSDEFFPLLGVTPVLGRSFKPSEYEPDNNYVLLLSYALWKRRFASDPHVLGKSVLLNSKPHTVIGVLPPGFTFKDRWYDKPTDVFLPLALTPTQLEQRGAPRWTSKGPAPGYYSTMMIARLRRGVSLAEAQSNYSSIIARIESGHPDAGRIRGRRLYYLMFLRTGSIGNVLWPLLGGGCLLLVISCINVSVLMLVRGLNRQREMAIRAALGASRMQIVGYFLGESLAICAAGGLLAVPLSIAGVDIFKRLSPAGYVPRLEGVGFDEPVLLLVFALVLLCAISCAFFPAIACWRSDLNPALKLTGDSVIVLRTRFRFTMQKILLVSQISAAAVLLIGASLMSRSLWLTIHQKLGFDARNTVLASLVRATGFQNARTWDLGRNRAVSEELLRNVKILPMVQAVALTDVDFEGVSQIPFAVGEQAKIREEDMPVAYWWNVSPEFFQTMSIPLLQGRYLTDDDGGNAQPVVVVNDALARAYFHVDAVGRIITHPDPVLATEQVHARIVGVVGDTRMAGLRWPVGPEIYTCMWQNIGTGGLILRSDAPIDVLAGALREKTEGTSKDLALTDVKPVEQAIEESSIDRPRFLLSLLGAFAALALILAVVGVFGAAALSVRRRTHEIGIRIALGAQKKHVLRTVLFDSTVIALSGVAVGTLAALALTRLIRSWLYGIPPDDPLTFVASGVLLLVICLIAAYIPSRRALRVDPAVVLRVE